MPYCAIVEFTIHRLGTFSSQDVPKDLAQFPLLPIPWDKVIYVKVGLHQFKVTAFNF